MMNRSRALLFAGLLLSASVPALAASSEQPDLKRGEQLVKTRCMACHNTTMLKQVRTYPSLYGQKSAYLFKQLTDFKEGRRTSVTMQAIIQGLTEQDFRDAAEYWGSLAPVKLKGEAKE